MKVGTLEIEMLANMARLRKDMADAKQIVGHTMGDIERTVNRAKVALGALGVGLSLKYFTDMVKGSVDAMDHLNDLSKTTKITVENLAGLRLAAKQSGGDLDSIAGSVLKLSQNMGKDAEKFRQLGVTAKEPLEAFKQLADIFNKIDDPQLRAALGAAALGKSWAGAAPLLSEGSEKIAEMIENGKKLSGITQQNAEDADAFNDKLAEFQTVLQASKDKVIGDMLPAMTQMLTAIQRAYEEGGKWNAMIETISQAGRFAIYDEYADQVKKLTKEYKNLADMQLETGLMSKIRSAFGVDKDIEAEMARVAAALKKARDERDKDAHARGMAEQDKRALAGLLPGKKGNDARVNAFLADGAAKAAKSDLADIDKLLTAIAAKGAGFEADFGEKMTKLFLAFSVGKIDILQFSEAQAGLIQQQPFIKAGIDQEVKAREHLATLRAAAQQQALDDLELRDQLLDAMEQSNAQLQLENNTLGMTGMQRALYMVNLEEEAALKEATGEADEKYIAQLAAARRQMLLTNSTLQDQQNRWNNLANAMGQYFGKVGANVGKLITLMVQLGKAQADYAAQRKIAEEEKDPIKREEKLLEITKASTQHRLGAYGDMASAAAGFFDEQDRGYKALMAVSKVFHAAELAMTIAELVPKAIGAVLNQGNGDPYTAFGRMAAMAAIVAGLGVAIGGGGSAAAAPSAKDRQAGLGTGSTLGDSMQKSASIAKALDLLGKTSIIGNEHTAAMLASLRSIENNIGGLASLVVRTSGLLGGKGDLAGLNLGPQSKGFLGLGKSGNSLSDQGILLAAQTVGQARQQFQGSQYSDVTTSGRTWYGKSFSNTNRVTGALGGDLAAQFSKIIDSLAVSILNAAKVMGAEENSIAALLNNFNIAALDISLKGLKGNEIEEQLQAIFGKLGDDMAAAVLPGLSSFQKVGEGLFETLMRLAQEFAATDAIAIILGKDVTTAFGAVGMASIKARDDLVQLFGGIEEMSAAVSKFYELYYSDAERLDRSFETIKGQFEALNVAMPGSIAAFRQLVEAQDLGTESGRAMFASLMQIAPAFHSVTQAAKTMADDIYSAALTIGGGLSAAGRQAAMQTAATAWNAFYNNYAGASLSNADTIANATLASNLAAQGDRSLLDSMIQGAFSIGGANAGQLLQNLFNAIAANTSATGANTGAVDNSASEYAQAMQALANARQGLVGYLNGSVLSDLSPLTLAQKVAQARSQLQTQIGLAGNNDLNAMAGLGGARDTFLKLLQQLRGFSPEYNAEYFSTFDQVNALTNNAAVRPMTAADAAVQTSAIVAALADTTANTDAQLGLTAQLLDLIANGISVNDPAVVALLQEIKNIRAGGSIAAGSNVI